MKSKIMLALCVFLISGVSFAQARDGGRGGRGGKGGEDMGISRKVMSALPEAVQSEIKQIIEKSRDEAKALKDRDKETREQVKALTKEMKAEKDKQKAQKLAEQIALLDAEMNQKRLADKQKMLDIQTKAQEQIQAVLANLNK